VAQDVVEGPQLSSTKPRSVAQSNARVGRPGYVNRDGRPTGLRCRAAGERYRLSLCAWIRRSSPTPPRGRTAGVWGIGIISGSAQRPITNCKLPRRSRQKGGVPPRRGRDPRSRKFRVFDRESKS
jgi:hypothetical protein